MEAPIQPVQHEVAVAEARMELVISNLEFEVANLRGTPDNGPLSVASQSIADRLEISIKILRRGGTTPALPNMA